LKFLGALPAEEEVSLCMMFVSKYCIIMARTVEHKLSINLEALEVEKIISKELSVENLSPNLLLADFFGESEN